MAKNKIEAQRLGRRIAAAREFRGWEQNDFAVLLGVRRRTIARWESGVLTKFELALVATMLKLPASHFLESCALCGVGVCESSPPRCDVPPG